MKLPVKVLRELNLSPSADDGTPFLAAGSGLACVRNWMYVAADDELSVGVFPANSKDAGTLYRLFDGGLSSEPKQRKRQKPDIESILLLPNNHLLLIPSGSKSNRVNGSLLSTGANGEISQKQAIDFSILYEALGSHIDGLNIEGATIFGEALLLFQRGNKKNGDNAIITLDYKKVANALDADRQIGSDCLSNISHCTLQHIGNVPLSFTDACTLDDKHIVFTATAEDTDNPYDDGKALGSIVGILDSNFSVVSQHTIDFSEKIEGLWIKNRSPLSSWDGEVLLVTDADNRHVPAKLLFAKFLQT